MNHLIEDHARGAAVRGPTNARAVGHTTTDWRAARMRGKEMNEMMERIVSGTPIL